MVDFSHLAEVNHSLRVAEVNHSVYLAEVNHSLHLAEVNHSLLNRQNQSTTGKL
jgi:hypothetical protein